MSSRWRRSASEVEPLGVLLALLGSSELVSDLGSGAPSMSVAACSWASRTARSAVRWASTSVRRMLSSSSSAARSETDRSARSAR